jgi:Cu/Ag efflux pump CusA
MIGGIVTSTVIELIVFPAVFYLWRARGIKALKAENSTGPAKGNSH